MTTARKMHDCYDRWRFTTNGKGLMFRITGALMRFDMLVLSSLWHWGRPGRWAMWILWNMLLNPLTYASHCIAMYLYRKHR